MKPKLIILEGPDCTGKSTLGRYIAAHLPAFYIHASGDKSLHHAMLAYHMSIIDVAKVNLRMEHSVIIDRLWPSELVYGSIFRPNLSDRVYDFEKVVTAVQELDPLYIFCGDDESHIRHQKNIDPSHPYTLTQYEQVCDSYLNCEQGMRSEAAMLLFNPKRQPIKFRVRHYNMLIDGQDLNGFLNTLL